MNEQLIQFIIYVLIKINKKCYFVLYELRNVLFQYKYTLVKFFVLKPNKPH